MPSPRLSVALATYNGAAFLPEQLRSLADQTRPPDELVVSDDGSADATLDIVRAFAATARFPVRVLPKPARLGFSDNFLFAAEHCAHEFVAFCDQDDRWLPRKLEIGVDRLVRDDSLLSLHRLTLTDAALRPAGVFDQGIAADAVYGALELDPCITGWGNTMVFRRDLVGLAPRARRPRQPGLERPLSHDSWIYALAAALGRVSHIAEPLILYRQHDANAMGVEQPTSGARWRRLFADPVPALRAQALFDREMEDIFAELATRADADLRPRARVAAVRFAERGAYLGDRAEAYGAATPAARARALIRSLRHAPPDGAARYRGIVKDLALGVVGAGRRRSSPRRPEPAG